MLVLAGDWSAGSVGVASMFDAEDDYLTTFVGDSVEHTVGSAPRGADPCELAAKRLADSVRFANQRRGEELDHCRSHWFRKALGERSGGGWGDNELVRLAGCHDRRRRTASTPRMKSPR